RPNDLVAVLLGAAVRATITGGRGVDLARVDREIRGWIDQHVPYTGKCGHAALGARSRALLAADPHVEPGAGLGRVARVAPGLLRPVAVAARVLDDQVAAQ